MSGTMGCDRLLENFPQITSGQTYKIYNQHIYNLIRDHEPSRAGRRPFHQQEKVPSCRGELGKINFV